MKQKISYSEKLKDPRWQRKRLEIMQRDNFTCQCCWDKMKTLHVHHKYYLYGVDPWDHDDNCLVTLCATCHENEESYKPGIERDLFKSFSNLGFLNFELESLIGLLNEAEGSRATPQRLKSLLEDFLFDYDFRKEVGAIQFKLTDISGERLKVFSEAFKI